MSNWDGCWVISTKNPYDCWMIEGYELEEFAELTVHAWCDLRPYGG